MCIFQEMVSALTSEDLDTWTPLFSRHFLNSLKQAEVRAYFLLLWYGPLKIYIK